MIIFGNNSSIIKIIIIVLAFVIIAGGFFIFFWKLNQNTQSSNQPNGVQAVFKCNQLSGPDKDFCYKDAGFGIDANGGDASLCGKISDSMVKNACLKAIALQKKDISICDSINIVQSEGKVVNIELALKDECYQNVAVALRDSSFCNKIVTVQYQCSSVGIGLGMISLPSCNYSEKSCIDAVTNFRCQTLSRPDGGWCPSGKMEVPNKDTYGCPSVPTCQ